ncbi:hypothetical protein QUF80_17235 [Desulfococcaceae bacterium HSG8]|nr:hypothetical protein [Desulfococcaceae bacterium HSG8]
MSPGDNEKQGETSLFFHLWKQKNQPRLRYRSLFGAKKGDMVIKNRPPEGGTKNFF